jgi:heat shock protein HtpX
MTLYTHQASNTRKTWLLMFVFFALVAALGWSLSAVYQSPAIFYVAILISIGMNVVGYWYSDRIVTRIAGAKPVAREEHRELWNILENLSITAGLPMPKLYLIQDSAPNAFATGRDKEHAVVAVTTGLVALLDRSELEGVIAHELAHIGNKDMLLATVAVVLVGLVTLLSDLFLRMGLHGGSRDNKAHPAVLIIALVLAILSPIAGALIQLSISRKREFLADATGALLTRYPEGLARALEKISASGAPLARANHATAHLYIANPFAGKKGLVNKLFSTHPPVEERVRALRGEML